MNKERTLTMAVVLTILMSARAEEIPEFGSISQSAMVAAEALLARADVSVEQLLEASKKYGSEFQWALLKHMFESAESRSSWVHETGRSDAEIYVAAVATGRISNKGLRRRVSDQLNRRELHPLLRIQMIVLLASAGDEIAARALTDRALDEAELGPVRNEALFRLPFLRVDDQSRKRLETLLYEPRHNIDVVTAATLSRMGRHTAPSLVVEGLRFEVFEEALIRHCAAASNAICGVETPLPDLGSLGSSSSGLVEAFLARTEGHAARVEKWLKASPSASQFEARRREMLAGREWASIAKVPSEKDLLRRDDWDCAAAIFGLTTPGPSGHRVPLRDLLRVERLAEQVRRRVGKRTSPEAIINVLNAVIIDKTTVAPFGNLGKRGTHSILRYVLSDARGNCLGISTLYYVVCQRLKLPVRIVASPSHCFLRWDDGTFRRNIEPVEGGKQYSDDHYWGGKHRYLLQPLSKRGVVSLVCSNVAAHRIDQSDYVGAHKWATLATKLEERNYLAHLNRAIASYEQGQDFDDVLVDVSRSVRIVDGDPATYVTRGGMFEENHQYSKALNDYTKAHGLRASLATELGALRCRIALGQEEAYGELVRLSSKYAKSPHVAAALAEAEVRLGRRAKKPARDDIRRGLMSVNRVARALVERSKIREAKELLVGWEDYVPAKPERSLARLTSDYWSVRAIVHLKMREPDQAAAAVRKGLAQSPRTRRVLVAQRLVEGARRND